MKDFARLNVYIADSNVIITQEMQDYTSTQLVSDIGGQLGLWVGISIITLAEVRWAGVSVEGELRVGWGEVDGGSTGLGLPPTHF